MHQERIAIIRELMAVCGAAYARSGEARKLSECAELIERGRAFRAAVEAVLETSGVPSDTLARISEHLDDYVHACNCAGASSARYARTRGVSADAARRRNTDDAESARKAIEALLCKREVITFASFSDAVDAQCAVNDGRIHGLDSGRYALLADDESTLTQPALNEAASVVGISYTLINW